MIFNIYMTNKIKFLCDISMYVVLQQCVFELISLVDFVTFILLLLYIKLRILTLRCTIYNY